MVIVGVFVASLLMLLGGIHQTSSITSSRPDHDVSFDPPVPRHHNVHRSLKNTSTANEKEEARKEETEKTLPTGDPATSAVVTRESEAQVPQTAKMTPPETTKGDENVDTKQQEHMTNDDDMLNVTLSDRGGENVTVTDLTPKSFPHAPQVQYLGVLIDAGRHYFPISWLKDLIDILHRMQFNFIHFRLTDDQAFNVRLESHPELAKPSAVNNPNGSVYSTDELVDLVAYATEKNITIMPEINVPGHAGAWSGIPGFLVPCPEFICLKGYGLCVCV
jgi:hypothetical protein